MSRLKDAYNFTKYAKQVYTGEVSPLRLANDLIIKPGVFAFSRKFLGANDGEIKVADDIFEGLYSAVNLDPIAALSNFKRAYQDYRYYSGKTTAKPEGELMKTKD